MRPTHRSARASARLGRVGVYTALPMNGTSRTDRSPDLGVPTAGGRLGGGRRLGLTASLALAIASLAAALGGALEFAMALALAALGIGILTSGTSVNAKIALGFGIGLGAGALTWWIPGGARSLGAVDDVGWLFVRLLKMLVAPLVFLAIASGLARLGSTTQLGRLGFHTLVLYFATMFLAVATGLVAVNLFAPGTDSDLLQLPFFEGLLERAPAPAGDVPASFRGFVGSLLDNPLASLASPNPPILSLVFFGALLGIAVVRIGEPAKPLRQFVEAAYSVVLWMIGIFVQLAPLGVLAIVWSLIGSMASDGPRSGATAMIRTGREVGGFMLLVFGATSVHALVTLPAFAWMLGGVHPRRLFQGISEALMVAFSTSSSAATLPVTARNVESNLGVPAHVAHFVLPLGATVNMDGTALYEAIAALFVANLFGIELSLGAQLIVFGMSMLMAAGAPAIPSAGMATMVVVLQAVDLPVEAVALLIPLDRVLDTIRTMANVEGDAVVAVCVASTSAGPRAVDPS